MKFPVRHPTTGKISFQEENFPKTHVPRDWFLKRQISIIWQKFYNFSLRGSNPTATLRSLQNDQVIYDSKMQMYVDLIVKFSIM